MGQPDQPSLRCEFEMDNLVVKLEEVIPSVVGMIDGMVAKIMSFIGQSPCWDDADSIELVLREALANAMIHGNRADPTKLVRISVAIQADCTLLIVVKDAGEAIGQL